MVDALTRWNASWGPEPGPGNPGGTVTYSFSPYAGQNYVPMDAEARARAHEAFRIIAEVADITFEWTDEGGDTPHSELGNIVLRGYKGTFPLEGTGSWRGTGSANEARITSGEVELSGVNTALYLHEIGHALGLAHPGEYDGTGFSYKGSAIGWDDTKQFTLMSYWSPGETGASHGTFDADTLMLHDIAALQHLYGANMETRADDTVYGFGSDATRADGSLDPVWRLEGPDDTIVGAVWDAGGTDTLDLSGYRSASDVDLREEGFSSFGGEVRNFAIARGVTIENARTGAGDDTIRGNDAANAIQAGAGRDEVRGGRGNDVIHGGDGNDRLFGEGNGDRLDGGAGHDEVQGGGGNDVLLGGAGVDRITGGNGLDRLHGGTGNDTLFAGAGDDALHGDAGADRLFGQDGNDVLHGGAHDDRLGGGEGDDALHGDAGADRMAGDGGADRMWGGTGTDILNGGAGDDALHGGADRDNLIGREGADTLHGDGGLDRLLGGAGDDRLHGGDDTDLVHGGEGADVLLGDDGADRLYGGANDDRLEGGAGRDNLFGQGGADTFVFADGTGTDLVVDFRQDQDDRIDVSGVAAITDWADLQTNHMTQSGDDVVLFAGADRFRIADVQLATLGEDDFVF